MTKNPNSFLRAHCDSCGAPLSRTRQKGKYICEHCASVYYDTNYQGDWEEGIVEPVVETPPPADIHVPVTPAYAKPHKKIVLWIWLACGAVLAGCVVLSLLGGVLSNISSGSPVSEKAIDKPVMLSALPSAEAAGMSVGYADWEIEVNPDVKVNDDKLSFEFTIKNWTDSHQVLRYKPNTIIVYDDLGNTYPVHLGSCDADLPYLNRQVSFDPYGKATFSSNSSWCNRETNIPTFFGVIPINAAHLYLHFEDFGVFKNITFVFDL